jgi:hypothetical protein
METRICRSCAKLCTKLLKESFYMNYLVILTDLPRWILQLQIYLFLSPTSWYCLVMLRCTSGEFTLNLSLLEILFPNLCLFLIINVYIKIHNSYKCVCWFLRLVLGQSMCRKKFGFISVILILICINPLFAN